MAICVATSLESGGPRHEVITPDPARSLSLTTDGWGCRMSSRRGLVATGRPRGARTLKSVVLRVVVSRLAVFVAAATMFVLGHALAVDPAARPDAAPGAAVADAAASAPPTWTRADAAAYPGCVSSADWATGRPAAYVVVHSFRDDAHRMVSFDAAWRANHDDTEVNDVWVLGACQ